MMDLESKRVALNRCILVTNSLGYLGHALVVLKNLGVLQLVEVVHDPVVGLSAPNLGHQLLLVGRLHTVIESFSTPEKNVLNREDTKYNIIPGENASVGIDVNGGISESVEDELFINNVLSVLDENLLD